MINNRRNPDDPKSKDSVCAQLFGEFIGYCNSQGLTKGKEYETHIDKFFDAGKRTLWLDQFDEDWQITVFISSISMKMGFGVVQKKDGRVTKNIIYKKWLENMRYNISDDTELELIVCHRKQFDEMMEEFKMWFHKIKNKEVIEKTSSV